MKFSRSAGAFVMLAAAAVLSVGSASAAQFTATYMGLVTGSQDQTGLFGEPGGTLDGASFVEVFTYDTALGTLVTDGSSYNQLVLGGLLSASLTINGITISITPTLGGVTDYYGGNRFYINANANSTNATDHIINSIAGAIIGSGLPLSYDTPFTTSSIGSFDGFFAFVDIDILDGIYVVETQGGLSAQTLTVAAVTQADAVPEPVTLSIFGAGLAGAAAMRRRKVKTA